VRANGTAVSDFRTRLLQEIAAAPCKDDARHILENYAEAVAALDEATREQILAELQDLIAELPDEAP
jgi:hypothetical protein